MSTTEAVGHCCHIDFKIKSYLICIEGWRNTTPTASQTGLRFNLRHFRKGVVFMATYNGQVTGGGLNLRKSASTSSTKLTQIPDETKIVVSDYSGNSSWYCTTYGSYSGFVMKQYVTILSNVTSQSATVTGGGLNLRTYPSTSASSPVQIPNNTKITVQKHNASWSSTTYNGHSGFVMTQYLTIGGSTGGGETGGGDTGGGDTGGGSSGTGTLTYGKVSKSAGYLNIRKEPSTSGEIIGRLYNKDALKYYAGENHTGDGYSWYRIEFDGSAYVQAQFVVKDTTDDHTVLAKNVISYSPSAAEKYARNHTQDNVSNANLKNYNTTFDLYENDCANFVSQCLCAGGLPMFETWARTSVTGIPSSWNDPKNWNNTNRLRCVLLAKGRIKQISMTQVQKGDIIYNYDASKSDVHYRYGHVVIAADKYDTSTHTCKVHGHTENKLNYPKEMTDESKFRCYRVLPSIRVENCEKRVQLPESGSGGKVIE